MEEIPRQEQQKDKEQAHLQEEGEKQNEEAQKIPNTPLEVPKKPMVIPGDNFEDLTKDDPPIQ